MTTLRLCGVCKQQKPLGEFGPDNRKSHGKKYLCRDCESERARVRYHNELTDEQRIARIQVASARAKQRWAEKRERGECMNCSNSAVPGHKKCAVHLAEAAAREAERRKELLRIGVCTRCGQRPQAVGMRYCTECLVKTPRKRRWKVAPVPRKTYSKERYRQIRDECFAAYGGYRCKCCGETEPRFLTLDHINNDGAAHRKSIYGRSQGVTLYRWLRRNRYPADIRVLCFNCNSGRQLNGGICPHEQKPQHPIDAMLARLPNEGVVN